MRSVIYKPSYRLIHPAVTDRAKKLALDAALFLSASGLIAYIAILSQ